MPRTRGAVPHLGMLLLCHTGRLLSSTYAIRALDASILRER
jgi:hypothetical protein